MSVDHHPPYTVYRDQLSAPSHGLALWNPGPQKRIYDNVSIGDVGYLHEGTFIRMFNVTLPWDHPENELLGLTEPYDRLDCGPFTNTIETHFDEVVHISRFVTAESNADSLHAMAPDDIEGVTYKFRAPGALLSLPNGGRRQDAIRTKMFEDYIRDHVDKWFNWAQNNKLGVERMEDLILVTGCTLVTSWAAAAVVDNASKAEISLTSRSLNSGGASFVWRNVRGHVSYHNSRFDPQNPPTTEDQCVFLRGFRAKRVLFGIKVVPAGSAWDDKNPQRSRRTLQIQRNDGLRNTLSTLGDNSLATLGGSSSSLDTITSNPQGLPYPSTTTLQSNGSLYSASSSSLDTIRPPIINPQLLPYPSSTTVQDNGSLYGVSFMTSPSFDTLMEVQASEATPSTSNMKWLTDALVDYARTTGIDMSTHPFAGTREQSDSVEIFRQLLQERVEAFKKFRNRNRRLIDHVTSCFEILHAISETLGAALSLPAVHFPPAKAFFVGIDVLLVIASRVSSSYDALLDLFESLENFLRRLEVYTTIPPVSVTDIIIKIMIELLSVFALATKEIKQGRFKKFVKLWGKDKIQDALQRLDRLTNDEAVVYDLADYKTKKTKRERLVQYWLSPPDSSINHDLVSKLRHIGTAAWFFKSNKLKEWKETGSLLWIHGKPGAGKSTLLSAIIQDFERIHGAGSAILVYYYFDFQDVKKQDLYGLLSSLISQLSAESDSFYQVLSRLYSNRAGGMQRPITSTLTKCLKDMLSLPEQGPIYIIIDAIDECPKSANTPSAREEVLGLIKELIDLKLPKVYLCVASRLESDIQMVLEPLTSLRISLHNESGQKEDIINYINSVVHSDESMRRWREEDKRLVVDTLSDKADGTFRWVVGQVDTLRRTLPPNIRRVLNDVPKTLDETYCRTLLGIDDEKRQYARHLFRCLTVSNRPLLVEELAESLTVQFDEATPSTFNAFWRPEKAEKAEKDVMSICSSLVAVVDRGGRRVVQFSHFSIKEFLTSERLSTAEDRLSYYHVLPDTAHTILAHAGLSVLLQLDDKIDKNSISYFPLAPYAARHWVDHAQLGNKSPHIQEAMERLFDPTKPHFAAWVWLHDIDQYWLEPMSKRHPTQPEAVPLYYASLCGFHGLVERLVSAHPEDIESRGGSHTTPLHAASVKGHLDVASLLLKSGADPNSRDNMGKVPLHRVSQGGYRVTVESALEIARLLVNSGANPNVADNDGWTPLHAAAHCGYRNIAELLLGYGASLDVRNKNQETPLHLACSNGKLDVSHLLIDRSDVNSRDKNGFTPLHSASRYGHVDIARLLLNGGSEVNVQETQQWSPLHQASRYGHLDVAQLLIDCNADVNAHNADRRTPLHLASNNGHLDIAKLLVDRFASINSRNGKGETPLDRAAEKGYFDVTQFLIKSGAAVSDANDKGWTPFHKASYHGHLSITEFLLECGIDVDIRNGNGQTSLYLASSSGKLDVVSFLIEKGADIRITDNNSSNSLHIASQSGHLDVVQQLIKTGARIDVRNGSQKTPLALASIKGKVRVGRFLIEQGADINALDNRNQAPLHFASRHGHHDMARLLLDRGVDVNIQRDDFWSPLHLSSANGHMKVTELLVQCGADVDMFNGKQETPLYQAVWNGEIATARLLIERGANLCITDSDGGTLLHVASQRGHLGVVKLLLQQGVDANVLNKANQTAAKLASENNHRKIAKFIAEYKVDANIQDKDKEKPSLHTAAEEGNTDVLESLLEGGADVNVRNEGHRTPLNLAAAKGNVGVVCLLIEWRAEVDSSDKLGWTPLHAASRFGHLEVSRELIDRGRANVNARQKSSCTPLYLSARHGHVGIVKLLLERGADKHALNDKGETPYQASLRSRRPEIADLLREPSAG